MSQIIATASLRYFSGEPVFCSQKLVQFGPYFFENRAFLEDWKQTFKEELEKLNRQCGLKPDYVVPVFVLRGDPKDAEDAPHPEGLVGKLRQRWANILA